MSNTTEQVAFQRLINIMHELRNKCPWDKKQTIESLRPLTIEELYELSDAILKKDWNGLKEELGDVLLHIVFYGVIAKEQDQFTITEVINAICEKLIARHPHIYGDVKVNNEEDVKRNWEQLKLKEGKSSALEGVPNSLPALIKATRIQEKASKTGFDWPDTASVWQKVEEEINELKQAVKQNDQNLIDEEMGDVLFSIINYSRFINTDADTALEKANRKFIKRFQLMEQLCGERNLHFGSLSLTEMDELWNEVKKL